ncbi:MAG: (d)CMP kinase [Candidatus Nanohaloarchaea archaeon]
MGSRIEEFKDGRQRESEIVIAIGGPSKSGKSTLAEHIAQEIGVEHVSAGDFFREIAAERGMTVEELSEKADRETDIEVDRRTLEAGLEKDCMIDGRLAAWVLGDYADLTIYVTADLEERARRLAEMENIEQEEAEAKVKKRDEDNNERYREYYGIEVPRPDIYDVVVDNTELSIEEQEELVDRVLQERFPGEAW